MATETARPAPASSPIDRSAVAPVWHTVLFIVFVAGLSVIDVHRIPNIPADRSRLQLYAMTIVFEVVMVVYVWLLGLRPRGKTMRELIGGRWSQVSDVLMDIAVAILFWMAVVVVLAVIRLALGGGGAAAIRAVKPLLPQSLREMAAFVVLSVTAGFCEEFLFRGYLQRQFLALTGAPAAAVVLQAIVFGSAHLYQGWRNAVAITIYGVMFGILAVMRKSLRPGMIQHVMQDSISGILGTVLARHGYF